MSGAAATINRRMTVEEFLDWDGGGHQGKLELVNGYVRAMAPASPTHSIIQGNAVYLIRAHLRKQSSSCIVAPEAIIKPRLDARRNVRVPDVVVTCAPPSREKTFENPVLIVEVLSPSNEGDTWESITACATIPSMQEILILQSERIEGQILRKGADGAWLQVPELMKFGDSATLHSIDFAFALTDFYAQTYLIAELGADQTSDTTSIS